jgi:hypothetical protein
VLLCERHGFVHYGEVACVVPTGDVRQVDYLLQVNNPLSYPAHLPIYDPKSAHIRLNGRYTYLQLPPVSARLPSLQVPASLQEY